MKRLAVSITMTALMVFCAPLAAATTRGCNAAWEVRAGSISRAFGEFSSRGQCKGKAWANDCRRHARTYAIDCFWDHWARRNDTSVKSGARKPPHCVGRGNLGVRNYRLADVKQALELQACAMPFNRPFKVQVVGRTFGGKRCGNEKVLSTTYEVRDRMCGKIGN